MYAMHEEILNRFISKSKLFCLLDEAGRDQLIGYAKAVKFQSGEVILKEGDTGESFFVLTSGTIRVFAEGFDGNQELGNLGPGAVFGEIAAINGEPRTATVVSQEDSTAVQFIRSDILGLLEAYPQMEQALKRIGLMRSEDALEKMLES